MLDAVSIDHCRLLVQTLGHSLWQAGLIAGLCWLILRSLPARRVDARYTVACSGLIMVVLMSLVTAATVSTSSVRPDSASEFRNRSTSLKSSAQSVETGHPLSSPAGNTKIAGEASDHDHVVDPDAPGDASEVKPGKLESNTPLAVVSDIAVKSDERSYLSNQDWPFIIAGCWGLGVLAMLFRLVRMIAGLQKLRSTPSSVNDSVVNQLREIIEELSHRMQLRWPVRLVISEKVSVPGIVGTFWPTLLMPPAMLTGIPVEQLRIVIAHELAHARRLDFLVNLGQLLVESLLFFNPAVWWLSRQIRIEREACCDAVAVAATGSAVPVARTLLAIMDRLNESLGQDCAANFALTAGIQSLAGDESPRSQTPLFDRVRRIVTPEQRPHTRVPWYTLVGVIVAYAGVSFGLYEGADATVQIVRRVLTPEERIEKIDELVASQGDLARREGVPAASPDEAAPGELFPEPVTVSGVVRTSDGSPLPAPLSVYGTFSAPGIVATEGFANLNEPAGEFKFSEKTSGQKNARGDTGTLSLHIGFRADSEEARRFAPTAIGPFPVKSGQVIDELELILEPGFDGKLRVVDPSDNPISDAFLFGTFHVADASSYARLGESRSTTDQKGLITISSSTSKLIWSTDIRAAGFQKKRVDLTLKPDETHTVILTPARPTSIQVTSGNDGKPVAGAFAYNILDQGTHNGHGFNRQYNDPRDDNAEIYQSKYAPLYRYGPSDSNGRLTLDSLADGNIYEFLVMAPGYGPAVLKQIEAGDKPVDLPLYPELSVSGQIIGDLSQLRSRGRPAQKYLQYRNPDRRSLLNADVEERDGKGHFQIHHLGRGGFWLQLPDRTVARKLTETIDDLIIDLNEPPRDDQLNPWQMTRDDRTDHILSAPTRKVVLHLTGAAPSIRIDGEIRAGYIPRDRPGAYRSANYQIRNRQIEFDVEVPTKIHWIGKDFSGYSVVKESGIEVGIADEPFEAAIQLVPAGAVRGEVRLADGSLAQKFQTYVLPVERIDGFNNRDLRIDNDDAPGEFLLRGLPLGHHYQALVIDERPDSVASLLSEPFQLDAASPIADLKFQFEAGFTHAIQLVDRDGQPANGARAGVWIRPTSRFSRSGGLRPDDNGRIVMKHITESIPGRMELHIKPAGGFVGRTIDLDWNSLPETIMLVRGVSASGRLVDAETRRGLAETSFQLIPQPASAATSHQSIPGRTDEDGSFSLDSLEPINYQLSLYGGVPPRVPLVKNRIGVVEPDYSEIKDGTFPEWHIRGGREEPYLIPVRIVPKRGLKLAPASAE